MIIGVLCQKPGQPDEFRCASAVDDGSPLLTVTLASGSILTLYTGVVVVMAYADGSRVACVAVTDTVQPLEQVLRDALLNWEEAHP